MIGKSGTDYSDEGGLRAILWKMLEASLKIKPLHTKKKILEKFREKQSRALVKTCLKL